MFYFKPVGIQIGGCTNIAIVGARGKRGVEGIIGDIIVAGRNFGTGSSREQAATALKYRGIRAVIASSFGDIHRNNCLKNGVLPVGEITPLTLTVTNVGDAPFLRLRAIVPACGALILGTPNTGCEARSE